MIYKKLSRAMHRRDDGWLCELISMNYDDQPFKCLHSYVVAVAPGMTRANHYHRKKKEWLALAGGKLVIILEDVNTREKDKVLLDAGSGDYNIIYIPPFVAHAIKNVNDHESSLVIFSNGPEDKEDTIRFEVEE